MDINVNKGQAQKNDDNAVEILPLLEGSSSALLPALPDTVIRNNVQQLMNQTFESTASLAKLLPTGTVMAFHLLAPMFTNQGVCDRVSRLMTAVLVLFCAVSCFLISFTDSFRDKDDNVVYDFATIHGLWVIDGSTVLPSQLADRYRLRFIDFLHAITSVQIFTVIALLEKNTVQCFFPAPSVEIQEVLTAVPVGIGVLCSWLYVTFPSRRNGIGFPLK